MGRGFKAGIVIGLFVLASPLMAQTTAPSAATETSAAALSAATRAGAATRLAGTRATSRSTTIPTSFMLNFKDAPIDAVLDYFSKTLGFEILKDSQIDARVTMISKQEVSADQAIDMLSASLQSNAFAVIRKGNLLEITPLDKAKRGNVPVHFGADPADIADTEELITQVIPIQNVKAAGLKDDLKNLVGQNADISSNDGSNTIIITDISSHVKRLAQIISEIDQHESTTSEIRIVQLKHANATNTAKLIDTLFKQGPAQPQQQNRFGPQPQQPDPNAGANGPQKHGTTVVTAADDRTNTLLVMASADTLKLVDDVIAHVDADLPNPASTNQMKVYNLKFANASATAGIINDVFKPKSGSDLPILFIDLGESPDKKNELGVNAVADDRTNTIIATGPAELLTEVGKLIDQLDASPMSGGELRSIHLKNADAEDVAKLIQDMFVPKNDQSQFNPFDIFSPFPAEQKEKGVKIVVNADERTNILFVDAPKEWLDLIEKVAHEVDVEDVTEDTLFIYHLRNGQAQHLEYTLNVLFGNIGGGGEQGQQGQQPNQNGQNGQNGNNQLNLSSNPDGSPNTNTSSNRNNNRNQNQNQNRGGSINPNLAHAVNSLTNKVLVVAEPDTNSLIITTARKYEKQVREIVAELDAPVPQVLIRCLVAEVTHDNSRDWGVDFSVLNVSPSGATSDTIGSTLGAAAAAAGTAAPPGMVVKVLEKNVQATIQALAQQNKLDILSRPYILTSDNQEADITVGDQFPFITESRLDSLNNTINTITYRDIGIILDVTPHINPDGLVVMDVNPQISSLTGQTVPIQAGVNAPLIELRSSQSRVAIQDGQTIVIGGLMQDQKTDHTNKIPILGDLPLLGALFSYNSTDKTKTELLIFLTPHVVLIPPTLINQTQDDIKGLKLVPNAVAPGVMQEQLNGMARGSISTTQPSQPLIVPATIPDERP